MLSTKLRRFFPFFLEVDKKLEEEEGGEWMKKLDNMDDESRPKREYEEESSSLAAIIIWSICKLFAPADLCWSRALVAFVLLELVDLSMWSSGISFELIDVWFRWFLVLSSDWSIWWLCRSVREFPELIDPWFPTSLNKSSERSGRWLCRSARESFELWSTISEENEKYLGRGGGSNLLLRLLQYTSGGGCDKDEDIIS